MDFHVIIAIVAVVILFLFSIRKFSRQIRYLASNQFKNLMKRLTSTPLKSTVVGTGVTSIIQSSSATTVILVGLVDAGVIPFFNSLGVIFGANLGTTVTSQLVALNLTAIAPVFIILGFLIEFLGGKYKVLGRPIFYFGLVFFSLSLIEFYIEPIKSDPSVMILFSNLSNIFVAILAGLLFTVIVQSSSITSGLVVVLAGSGLIGLVPAMGVIFGANIGTTATSLIASLQLSNSAKKTAIAHLLFNVIGVVIFLPFIVPFSNFIISLGGGATNHVANAHLMFNLTCVILALIFIKPFSKLTEKASSLILKDEAKKKRRSQYLP